MVAPIFEQIKEQSGTWFRDARKTSNLARPLSQFHSPEGLLDQLRRDKEVAEQQLKLEGFAYLKLRDYQQKAIQAVETALQQNQQNCLLAMATGTGKTRTIIGLMYRFLKAERFKRILFLVDRTALGDQALDAFKETTLEQNLSLQYCGQFLNYKTLLYRPCTIGRRSL
ncbi:DEAD/DEAH box helicase family protein, partial [Spartinivicinus poritis]